MAWTQKLMTGIEWQDNEHKELLTHLALLLDAMKQSTARKEVANIIEFLDRYSRSHFTREEALMREFHLPGEAAHVREHVEFKQRIVEFLDAYSRQGGSSFVVMHVQQFMQDWLIKHILDTDKKMAAHYLLLTHA